MQMPSSVATRLQYQHKTLLDLLEGLSDDQIRKQVIPGKWSIFEQIVHLQTYQHAFVKRVRSILENESPVFERYAAEKDPEFIEYCAKSTREVMQDLLQIRKQMAAELVSFQESDYEKKGTHGFFGEMNLMQWTNFFLLHEGHHLFAIFRMAAQLKKA